MKCDSTGVPLLIQRLKYWRGDMTLEATFFNNKTLRFCSDDVCPSIGLMQAGATRMQMLEAENSINKMAAKYWQEWFPLQEGAHNE